MTKKNGNNSTAKKVYDSDIVGWATINGRRVPIRKGKAKNSESSAYERQLHKVGRTTKDRSETYMIAGRKADISQKTKELDKDAEWFYGRSRGERQKRQMRERLIEEQNEHYKTGGHKGEYGKVSEHIEASHASENARKARKKKMKGSQEYSSKEWDALPNRQRKSIIEAESKRNKKKGIRALERKEPE